MTARSLHLGLVSLLLACGPSAPSSPGDPASTSGAEPASTTASSSPPPVTTSGAPDLSTSSTDPPASSTTDVASTSSPEQLTFLVAPDGGSCLVNCSQCNPFTQDCPEGNKCSPWANDGGTSWNATKCVPIDPDPDQPGDPCTVQVSGTSGIDSCDLHSMCWDVDVDTLIGHCVPFCTGSPENTICPDGLTCIVANEGNLPICLPSCDPLQQDCAPGDVCISHPNEPGFVCIFDGSGDEGQSFDACDFANECDPGLLCNQPTAASECDFEAQGCCLPFCDLSLPVDCPGAMQTCQPAFEMGTAPEGLENVGFCALP